MKQLKGELRQKQKALAEAAALLMLQKSQNSLGEPEDARSTWRRGLRGLSPRTLQRWRESGDEIKTDRCKQADALGTPANKLTEQEHQQVLDVVNAPVPLATQPDRRWPTRAFVKICREVACG